MLFEFVGEHFSSLSLLRFFFRDFESTVENIFLIDFVEGIRTRFRQWEREFRASVLIL